MPYLLAAPPRTLLALALAFVGVAGCTPEGSLDPVDLDGPVTLALPYEQFTLDNGLEVVLHVDRSDPVVAVALTFHVGSAREIPGRTGFAHLFEHLFFLDSENLGPGGLDRLMTRIGSSTNGSTSRDRTNYFEVVPRDGLEKTLWAEADKLGFFINTVTEDVLAKEKQVVKNEKRQGVDNQPYGHLWDIIDRALYPEGHPYRWQVIGSLEDLDAATLEDVKTFHERWYGPENAVLVVSGDLDVIEARRWIEHYFGEIPARAPPSRPEAPEVQLAETRRLFHEDNFAQLPQLTLSWPAVRNYHPDAVVLDLLARILTEGKASPFDQVLVQELELAPGTSAGNRADELAGQFTLQVRSYAGRSLDDVMAGIEQAFARFESEGVREDELRRVKAGAERQFYQSLSSVLGKAFQIAQYTMFAGTPDFANEELSRILAVTEADLVRVYETYLKGHPHVAVSFVPRGQGALALSESARAQVFEEPIVVGAEAPVEVGDRGEIARTPSRFDRSVEPPFGRQPRLSAPRVWRDRLENGMQVFGIEDRELPLIQFSLRIDGGMLLDDPERIGEANLLAETLTKGTAQRTPEELELAIQLLGASIGISAGREAITVSGTTLARNWRGTLALLEEILLEPRFDPEEFELARRRVTSQVQQRAGNPNAIADQVFATLLYGEHPLAQDPRGELATLQSISLDDVKAWAEANLRPDRAVLHVAGATTKPATVHGLRGLRSRWVRGEPLVLPADPDPTGSRAGVFFVDLPGAPQSVLRIGYLAMAESNPGYWPAQVMNFRLGGGGFASELTQTLREGLGYTYGISSGFRGGARPGPFQIGSAVRSNVTLESVQVIRELLEAHGPNFTEADLEITRGFLLRNNAGAFETLGAKLGLLSTMSSLGFPRDYALRRAQAVERITVDEIRTIADEALNPNRMAWVVIGDAQSQLSRLEALGLGPVTLLNREGERVQETPPEGSPQP